SVEDFANARVLDRLLVYERRIENSLYRTLRELREQKRVRLAGAPAEAIRCMSERISGGTSVLPVVRNPGQDGDLKREVSRLGTHAHATATPAGVTTHPSAQQSCETKPISARTGRVPGDDSPRKEFDKTNPICATTAETAVFEAEKGPSVPALGGSVETKPISRGDPSSLSAVRRVA
ncbi:MAG: hypothetical protein M1376_14495, partial [Planctomycetes bacterium]|nr:hypothetical protein [Planctomycetota bacterium]